jgi:hypothetical protein
VLYPELRLRKIAIVCDRVKAMIAELGHQALETGQALREAFDLQDAFVVSQQIAHAGDGARLVPLDVDLEGDRLSRDCEHVVEPDRLDEAVARLGSSHTLAHTS